MTNKRVRLTDPERVEVAEIGHQFLSARGSADANEITRYIQGRLPPGRRPGAQTIKKIIKDDPRFLEARDLGERPIHYRSAAVAAFQTLIEHEVDADRPTGLRLPGGLALVVMPLTKYDELRPLL